MRVPFPAEGSSRKKAGSVNFGRQPWKTEEREDQRVSQNVSRVLSESLLPHALFDHKSLKFAATVVADFLVIFTNFFLIANAGPISKNSAHLSTAFLGQLVLGQVNILGWLALIRWQQGRAHARGRGVRRALIIGAGALGREVAAALESDDGRKLVGFLDNEQLGGTVLGRVSDLSRIARAEFVDEIIVA